MTKKNIVIEESLKNIKNIVNQIENNEVDLKKSLLLYSDAIKTSKEIIEELAYCEEQFNILNKEKDSLNL